MLFFEKRKKMEWPQMGLRTGSDPANYETDFVLIGLLYQLCYIHPILIDSTSINYLLLLKKTHLKQL